MATKILSSPFPPEDSPDAKRGTLQKFDLESRKVLVNRDASPGDNLATDDIIQSLGLYVVARNLELVVDLLDINYIGRSYPQNGHFDGIDFSAFEAYTLGVSRQHAILKREGRKLFIIDNNSSNGTYLNRVMLQPLQAYHVQHDDNLRLGAFDLVIKLD